MAAESVFIGIGFGTLNSTIAIVGKDNNGETIANEDGDRIIPSYVAYTGYEELVGSQAKIQAMSNQKGTIVQFKSLLGLKFEDEEVQHHSSALAMTITQHPTDSHTPVYEVEEYESEEAEESTTKHVSVSTVTTTYLAKLKETAEGFLGKTVTGCVVSVPAHFAAKSKQALIKAATDAGFAHVHTIVEPVAAALAFDVNAVVKNTSSEKADRMVLVVDLGGHQFNVTLLSANNGLYSVVSSFDDHKLGGVHFDEVLVGYIKDEFKRKTKTDIGNNRRSLAKLRSACEQTKRMLSQKDTAPCSVDSLYDGIDFHGQVIRGRFENLAEPLFQRCADLIRQALKEGGVAAASGVDEVLFVGGSSRIPRFQQVIGGLFPETTKIRTDVEPDEAIGNGAAIQAGIIVAAAADGVDYVAASTNKDVTELAHLNHSVGLETASGAFVKVIPRLTPVPARRAVEFSNAVKGQTEVYLAVYEGEDSVAKKNTLLAEIVVSDLPEGLAVGAAKIDITFLIEKDEVLQVVAKERTEGKALKVKVTPAKQA
ncbi:heat shock protein 70 family [Chytriomyces cf. hyalinus JEL632]|nr:heat shock protein 70 family [Chytriomyces cf. hyalinus JEL632]